MNQKLPPDFPYHVVRRVGEGGYGITYLVEKIGTKEKYILKKIKKKDRTEVEKQYHNLRAVRSECRRYFVCAKELVDYKNNLYLIMEFLDGYIELFDYIVNPTKYPRTKTILINIAYELMKGLRALHRLGIAHRDIKPENIMIHPTRHDVRYIDFGLACRGESDCRAQTINRGTPSYMAPEIYLASRRRDAEFSLEAMQKTDVFSLGIVIAILFTKPAGNPVLNEARRNKFPSLLSFYQSLACPRILRELNDRYIVQPLGDPKIDLLNFNPFQRRMPVSRQQQEQNRSRTTRTLLLKKAKTL